VLGLAWGGRSDLRQAMGAAEWIVAT
jgi:hypothetical protein